MDLIDYDSKKNFFAEFERQFTTKRIAADHDKTTTKRSHKDHLSTQNQENVQSEESGDSFEEFASKPSTSTAFHQKRSKMELENTKKVEFKGKFTNYIVN